MAHRRNKHNTCLVNNLTLACLVRETHGGLDDRVSALQRMISLCEYDEYNINEKNIQVLLRRLILGKDAKAKFIIQTIENYFMSRSGRPCVVGIYMHLESKLESQKALAESINTRETLRELEKQYAYAFM